MCEQVSVWLNHHLWELKGTPLLTLDCKTEWVTQIRFEVSLVTGDKVPVACLGEDKLCTVKGLEGRRGNYNEKDNTLSIALTL